MSSNNELRERFLETIETAKRYYIDQSVGKLFDIENIGKDDKKHEEMDFYNLSLAFVSYATRGRHLLLGDPGSGKTSLAIIISSLLGSTPPSVVEHVMVKGQPDISEQDVKGRLHYGKLTNDGEEFVIWQMCHLFPFLNIDELQRIPTTKQSYFLTGLESGLWDHLNQTIRTGKRPGFVTMNEQDSGSYEITQALMERLTICSEHNHLPWCRQADKKLVNRLKVKELSHVEIEDEMLAVLGDVEHPYREKKKEIDELREQYRTTVLAEIETLPNPLNDAELEMIAEEIENIKLSPDAEFFGMWVEASINESEKYGVKRMSDPIPQTEEESVDRNFAVSKVRTPFSNRAQTDVMDYAKGIAWLRGLEEVDVETLRCVAANVLAHRIRFDAGYIGEECEPQNRDRMRCLAFTDMLLDTIGKDFDEKKRDYRSIINTVLDENGEKKLKPKHRQIMEDRHPLMRAAERIIESKRNQEKGKKKS